MISRTPRRYARHNHLPPDADDAASDDDDDDDADGDGDADAAAPAPAAGQKHAAPAPTKKRPAKRERRAGPLAPVARDAAAPPALFGILRALAVDDDAAVRNHAADVARLALDAESMDDAEKDAFMATFYERYMPWLVEPLYDVRISEGGREVALDDAARPPPPGARVANAGACAHVCELLAYPRPRRTLPGLDGLASRLGRPVEATSSPRRRREAGPYVRLPPSRGRTIRLGASPRLVATEYPRLGRGVAATRIRGTLARPRSPSRTRPVETDSPPVSDDASRRTIHVVATASLRPLFVESVVFAGTASARTSTA